MLGTTFLQLCLGIFTAFAALIGAVILKKYEQPWVIWLMISFVAFFLTLHVHFDAVVHDAVMAQKMITVALIIFALAALSQFYNIVGYTQ